jgi:8-oxo-dGTP pyrophosphatase MutT (NUDIX family)
MWLFTPIGFFSIVQKPLSNSLTIRARVRDDLETLRATYLPDLSETVENAGTDYPYRATATHAAFSDALSRIAKNINYANFKDEVARRSGTRRAHIYGRVWECMLDLEGAGTAKTTRTPGAKALSFGGVVINGAEEVLLVEPKNHYDGYVWTFPKGRSRVGERPEETAKREVREETGELVCIIGDVPGLYAGGTTINRYFLMRPGPMVAITDHREIEACRWVSYGDARGLLRKTTNEIGMKRDLAVLDAAFLEFARVRIEDQHKHEMRDPVRRDSLRVVPLDGEMRSIRTDAAFSPGEMDQIRRGHLSMAMEDKWNIFFEDDCLHACRSWTGQTVFVASFISEPKGMYRINSVQMASAALESMGERYACDLLLFLINRILLDRSWPFPSYPGTSPEQAALKAWHEVGSKILKT